MQLISQNPKTVKGVDGHLGVAVFIFGFAARTANSESGCAE